MSAGPLRPIQKHGKRGGNGKSRSNRATCGAPGRSFSGSSLAAAAEIGIGVGTGIGRNEKKKTAGQAGAVQPKNARTPAASTAGRSIRTTKPSHREARLGPHKILVTRHS